MPGESGEFAFASLSFSRKIRQKMKVEFYWDWLSDSDKAWLYVDSVVTRFDADAVFSDGTEEYCSPCEPDAGDEVTVRIRTGHSQCDQVFLLLNQRRIDMQVVLEEGRFDYYAASFTMPEEKVSYCFELVLGRIRYYFNKEGLVGRANPAYHFCLTPGFRVPVWAKGAVYYQIFVDRFCNGDVTNDVVTGEYATVNTQVRHVADWNAYPSKLDVANFYGGDLAGVIKKLDYLKALGVEVIYFNPLFVSPSNHKYDIQDYDFIDPHYGVIKSDAPGILEEGDLESRHSEKYVHRITAQENLDASNALFIDLVKEAHARDMKVVLDGVFNHCGSSNKWMDREGIYAQAGGYPPGAFESPDSPTRSYFRFAEDQWPGNDSYDGWWGHETLPKLNYEDSPELYQYIMGIAAKWVSPPYNADGWRLDMAADLGHSLEFNHAFWRDFRTAVKSANPNAILLAEHYGDVSDWLQGDQWDTVMNYDAFMDPVTWFLTGMEKHSDVRRPELEGNGDFFLRTMRQNMARFHTPSLQIAMNQLSNHDHSRFLTRTNKMVGRLESAGPEAAGRGVDEALFRLAVLMQMTWPGAPGIYYGDEAGVCGWTDPDSRRTYPWGRENQELLRYYREMIYLHRSYETLKTGSLLALAGEENYLCYGRFNRQDQMVVAINKGKKPRTVQIPVWRLGALADERFSRLAATTQAGYTFEWMEYFQEDGMLTVTLEPESGILLKNNRLYEDESGV